MNDKPLVFISYSHGVDEKWRDRLNTHLQGLAWTEPHMNIFVDTQLIVGDRWKIKIEEAIGRTAVAVLLVSSAFLKSDFIRNVELPRFLIRHAQDKMPIVPIILEDCAWKETPIADLLVRPLDGQPLSNLSVRDQQKALVSVAREINELYLRQVEHGDKITIVIADDREFTVRGLRDIFQDDFANDMAVVGMGNTPSEAERAIVESAPDILLLDLSWFRDDEAGFRIMDNTQRLSPRTKIIAISNHRDLLKKAEARGVTVLDKDFTIMELFACVRKVHASEPITDSSALGAKRLFTSLTDREREVLTLVAEGHPDKEVAEELHVSLSTVKKHMSNIIAKTETRSRTEAAVKAKEFGII